MHVIIDLCVVPLGVGVSVSPQIAACQRVIEASGLEYRMHAYGTNIEGPWDEVMAVVKRCHEVVHEMGAPRITTTIKLGTRTDREQSMADKVTSVQDKLRNT
ncbi:MTH1187 family thiamine-binding protein [Billgrantia lactosivorans]|uniref:MTH1187 family thiamine-binding protein n=1 Tax=Billgrantia lactosivorans TaxID=2185141 RepID=UPI000DABF4AA|nr:MTH1187 family thiamine-binding protein [Halomonas lactosivorans]